MAKEMKQMVNVEDAANTLLDLKIVVRGSPVIPEFEKDIHDVIRCFVNTFLYKNNYSPLGKDVSIFELKEVVEEYVTSSRKKITIQPNKKPIFDIIQFCTKVGDTYFYYELEEIMCMKIKYILDDIIDNYNEGCIHICSEHIISLIEMVHFRTIVTLRQIYHQHPHISFKNQGSIFNLQKTIRKLINSPQNSNYSQNELISIYEMITSFRRVIGYQETKHSYSKAYIKIKKF